MKKNHVTAKTANPRRRKIILVWCGITTVLLAMLWSGIFLGIARDRTASHASALARVSDLAKKYSDQVDAAIERADQLSILLVGAKESAAGMPLLQRQIRLMAVHTSMFPFYADKSGRIRSTTQRIKLGLNVSGESFFAMHRDSALSKLIIHPPGVRLGVPGQFAASFTRRVDRPDGSFDGVLAVSVQRGFFKGLAPDMLAEGDFASVWLETTGTRLVTQGQAERSDVPAGYRDMPVFVQKSGARLEPERLFFDQRAHYVGWKRVDDYPLLVVVAIRADNARAFAPGAEQSYLLGGLLITMLLLSGGAMGTLAQLARHRHQDETQNTFRLAVDSAREAFFLLIPDEEEDERPETLRIAACNRYAVQVAGGGSGEIIGKPFTEIFPQAESGRLLALLQRAMHEDFSEAEIALVAEGGETEKWLHFSAVQSDAGIAVTVRDISVLKGKEKQLKTMALTDPLTLLPNRHWLRQYLAPALDTAQGTGSKLALLFIDLDNFKKINDSYGHQAGDEYLVAVAAALRSTVRAQDHVVRLGGDEFTVLIEWLGGDDVAHHVAGEILARLQALDCPAVRSGFVPGASLGVAVFPDDASDASGLMQAADTAMYAAKALGKGQVAAYSTALAGRIQARLQLEESLQLAVTRDELQLYFQPRACAKTGKPLCLEALLRWVHPIRGLTVSAEFIPMAQESDLIIKIGNWVADEICAQLVRWREQGCNTVPVSMNISGRQLQSHQFRLRLAASLERHGIAPSLLAIELSESAMPGNDATTQTELRELRKMGVELHIDDFGTGYSSLSQLQRLDVNTIKIDQSFVQAIGEQEQSRKLCEAMVQIGHTLGFHVVAEGVENHTQLEALQQMGCDEIQGYLVSEPVPASAVPHFLRRVNYFSPAFPVGQRIRSSFLRGISVRT